MRVVQQNSPPDPGATRASPSITCGRRPTEAPNHFLPTCLLMLRINRRTSLRAHTHSHCLRGTRHAHASPSHSLVCHSHATTFRECACDHAVSPPVARSGVPRLATPHRSSALARRPALHLFVRYAAMSRRMRLPVVDLRVYSVPILSTQSLCRSVTCVRAARPRRARAHVAQQLNAHAAARPRARQSTRLPCCCSSLVAPPRRRAACAFAVPR